MVFSEKEAIENFIDFIDDVTISTTDEIPNDIKSRYLELNNRLNNLLSNTKDHLTKLLELNPKKDDSGDYEKDIASKNAQIQALRDTWYKEKNLNSNNMDIRMRDKISHAYKLQEQEEELEGEYAKYRRSNPSIVENMQNDLNKISMQVNMLATRIENVSNVLSEMLDKINVMVENKEDSDKNLYNTRIIDLSALISAISTFKNTSGAVNCYSKEEFLLSEISKFEKVNSGVLSEVRMKFDSVMQKINLKHSPNCVENALKKYEFIINTIDSIIKELNILLK